MQDLHALLRAKLPSLSYGPIRQMEAVPWLMLAASMRIVAFAGGLLAGPAIVVANVALLLAFVIVSWRMVLVSNGRSELGRMELSQQVRMAKAVLLPIFGLLVCATIAAAIFKSAMNPLEFMLGFDGIAFGGPTKLGHLWSACIAALVLLMVLQVDDHAKPGLFRALGEVGRRSLWLVPGIVLVAAVAIAISPVQDWFRLRIRDVWLEQGVPTAIKALLSLGYVVIFATLRLWLTVAILVLALRQSYRTRPGH